MKKITAFAAAAALALAAVSTWGAWVYEGQWGTLGTGNGEFNNPWGVALSPNGNVYVADSGNKRVQYFTPLGSFLGQFGSAIWDLAVGLNGNVYVITVRQVEYYTSAGSFLGSWGKQQSYFLKPVGIGIAPSGNVYVCDYEIGHVVYFTPNGSYLRKFGAGLFSTPTDVAISPDNKVYVVDAGYNRIQYFTLGGSYLGKWGSKGSGNEQFDGPRCIAIANNNIVFVTDIGNHRVAYFAPNGSFLGKWGARGKGNGQFEFPVGVAVKPTGSRVYVSDHDLHRVQYFNRNEPAVSPTSLGRVKALFR